MINIIMQLNENLYMDDFKGAFFFLNNWWLQGSSPRVLHLSAQHMYLEIHLLLSKHVNNYITYINDFKEYRFKENQSDWIQKGEKYIQKLKFTLIRQQILKRQKVIEQFEIDWTQEY